VENKTLRLLNEDIEKYLYDFVVGRAFFKTEDIKQSSLKKSLINLPVIIKNFCTTGDRITKTRNQERHSLHMLR
jgi:hypothetical protein